jgi:PAS domain S-box-containing protein
MTSFSDSPAGKTHRRSRVQPITGLIGLALVVVLTFVAFFAYSSWRSREAAIAGAERQTQNLVRTLEQHTSRTISGVDLLLLGLAEIMHLQHEAGWPFTSPEMYGHLRRRIDYAPQIRALIILDEKGTLLYDSDTPSPRPLDLSDRQYFIEARENPSSGLHIGKPIPGRDTGRNFIPLSRPLVDADGMFRGVIVAIVEPEYFATFYASLDVGRQGIISLFKPDGLLMIGGPKMSHIEAADILAKQVAGMPPPPEALIRSLSNRSGQVLSYGHVTGFPLMISVAFDESEVLESWRATNTIYMLSGFLIALAMSLLTGKLIQQLSRAEKVQAALSIAERDYRSIFDNAIDGIYRCDSTGHLLRANRAFAEMNGYATVAEMLAADSNVATRWYVDPDRRRQFREILERDGLVAGFVSEVRRHRSGERIWISENARAIHDASGMLLFYEGTIRDITDGRVAEERLREAKEHAELADRTKSEFLANMSHELRTPLNAVIGFSEIIKEELFGPNGNSRYQEYARDIHASGRHLLDLINEILDLAKVEAGSIDLREAAVNVPDLVEACRRLVRERAREHGLDLKVELAEPLPALRADQTRLKQILLNLLSNAIKFSPAGSRVLLTVRHEPDGAVVFGIADKGIGMTPEHIRLALQPFRQIENAFNRRHQGTGLGLPLAKAFTELHGGTLSIDSALGHGTVVEIRFPPSRSLLDAA